MLKEIHAPILPLLSYETEHDLERIIWSYEKQLSLYVFSNNKDFTKKTINKYSFWGGVINAVLGNIGNHSSPSGDVEKSGMGAYHGKLGFDMS